MEVGCGKIRIWTFWMGSRISFTQQGKKQAERLGDFVFRLLFFQSQVMLREVRFFCHSCYKRMHWFWVLLLWPIVEEESLGKSQQLTLHAVWGKNESLHIEMPMG